MYGSSVDNEDDVITDWIMNCIVSSGSSAARRLMDVFLRHFALWCNAAASTYVCDRFLEPLIETSILQSNSCWSYRHMKFCRCFFLRAFYLFVFLPVSVGGTAAAVPPPFRPSDPALCGSCPLVTPYYCRLGNLLCYSCLLYLSTFCVCMHMCNLCFLCVFFVLFSFTTFSFSTLILLVGSFDL